jgi:protein O-mannosyl-transferase
VGQAFQPAIIDVSAQAGWKACPTKAVVPRVTEWLQDAFSWATDCLPSVSSISMRYFHRESEQRSGLFVRRSPRLIWLSLFIIYAIIACALHSPGFDSPMLYDSEAGISDKEEIFGQGDLVQIMGMVPGRPLFMLTLYGNYLWHGMDPWFFRVADALLLAAAGLVLAILVLVLQEIGGCSLDNAATHFAGSSSADHPYSPDVMIAVLIGLLFVVHPVQSFAVLYIWQRQALMACFFSCAALAAYLAGRSGRTESRLVAYTAASLFFFGGMLSKESAITLPLLLIVSEFVLFRQTPTKLLKRIFILGGIVVPPLIGYLLVNHALQGPTTVHTKGVLGLLSTNYAMAEVSLPEVLGTECRVLFSYLFMIVAPFMAPVALVQAETISRSLWNPPTTGLAVAALALLFVLALLLIRRRPASACGLLVFVGASIPEAVLSPQYFYFGYRAILPMVGILLVLGDLLGLCLAKPASGWLKLAVGVAMIVWLIAAAHATLAQARNWRPLQFWKEACSRLPSYSPDVEKKAYLDVLINYGAELLRAGQYAEAIPVLRRAEAINSRTELIHLKLGLAFQKSGATREALESYRKAGQLNPANWSVLLRGENSEYLALGMMLEEAGDVAGAEDSFRRSLAVDPESSTANFYLGNVLMKSGNLDDAMRSYRRALELRPGYPQAHANLGTALLSAGRVSEAVESLEKALMDITNNPELHNALGAAYAEQGKPTEAAEQFRKALNIDPNHVDAKANLDRVSADQHAR